MADLNTSKDALSALRECDAAAQHMVESIQTLLSSAARAVRAVTPAATMDALRLLELASDQAASLENEINSLAERGGSSPYRDDKSIENAVCQRYEELARKETAA